MAGAENSQIIRDYAKAYKLIYMAMVPLPRWGTPYHTCPTCGGLLTEKYEHCRWCGQKLKWEG
ncbi:hypothetical protein SAMN02745168_0621 [Papillibacter cinnamivorans DSM 12816]|uniref:Zinc-ribbon domain-containing protein n=1 Tax=Papillibacter cinnamivorans DSM 12816 TaxID=1122930 RepID=A0A1W1YQD4_9FIRM|nr:hypothetical protein SAMN02745168_0621 [Papillibacter cinnamivorans DSM 12816]